MQGGTGDSLGKDWGFCDSGSEKSLFTGALSSADYVCKLQRDLYNFNGCNYNNIIRRTASGDPSRYRHRALDSA